MPDTPSLTQSHGDGFRLLVVDHDIDIPDLLADYLRKHGFTVESAADGAEMRRKLTQNSFDLLVLDIMMPGEDGLSLCRELRAKSRDANEPDTPVIFLTALGEATDRVVGLELGADDYVVKPFEPRELLARIRAVLRRRAAQREGAVQKPSVVAEADEAEKIVRCGPLVMNEARFEATVEGKPLKLSAKEFKLLFLFASKPGRVFSRENLLAAVWQSAFVDERTVDVHMLRLRKALAGTAAENLIETVRGVGYRCRADN